MSKTVETCCIYYGFKPWIPSGTYVAIIFHASTVYEDVIVIELTSTRVLPRETPLLPNYTSDHYSLQGLEIIQE
jgi:hypothetical protein